MSDIIERIALRFTSGNDVSIERAHITAEEWEELRRDAELWRALLKKVDSDQYQQFCVKFGDVLKAEIAAIDSARGVDKTERGAG